MASFADKLIEASDAEGLPIELEALLRRAALHGVASHTQIRRG
jgi:hypothetical protein